MAPKPLARSAAPRRARANRAKPAARDGRLKSLDTEHAFLRYGREVLALEAKAVTSLLPRLDRGFVQAVEIVLACRGHVVVTGMGKPGFIAQKLSATLASTGTPSIYLHPADAAHGDLGRVREGDVVLLLSNSGTTDEVLRLLPPLRRIGARIVCITGAGTSPLAKAADVVLDIGRIDEACPLGLVPTASSAALHAVCDALAMTVLKHKGFTSDEYALYHPGGSLGRRVMKVADLMRRDDANPIVGEDEPLHRAVAVMTNTPGRPGAANVVDRRGRLVGIFTDGDLRRLVERGQTDFSSPVKKVMGRHPRTCSPDDLARRAADAMREAKVDQLPVVDEGGRPLGLLDIQDLLAARFP